MSSLGVSIGSLWIIKDIIPVALWEEPGISSPFTDVAPKTSFMVVDKKFSYKKMWYKIVVTSTLTSGWISEIVFEKYVMQLT